MTEEEKKAIVDHDEQMRGYLRYGAQAGALAGVAATAALFGIQRYSVGLGTTVIAAENAVYQVRRPTIPERNADEPRDMASLLFHYRHPIVGGTFAAAVAAGALMYSRDPYRSGTQKFLNVRLYGQGLALVALFGTIGLGSIVAQHNKIEEERKEREAAERLYQSRPDTLAPSTKKSPL